ncbi:MAG: GSCFA domain-containing protein [Crocinitomicaceae bacterium]|nr:GSCFA domain-containing protein [Crocinitomicaceae bacterium]
MKLKLDFNIDPFPFQFSHKENALLIGSCFSEEMTNHFASSGFNVLGNPFGTLFHPLAIANCLKASISNDNNVEVYQRDDVFFSWDSASKIYGASESELISKVLAARSSVRERLTNAKLLVVTFGTAWGYYHASNGMVVGNCHKASQSTFEKQLTSIEEVQVVWKELIAQLKTINPDLHVVFTVSPVRHKKDGLAENNRSKARLIESVHSLCELTDVHYFPAYEILIDELRDYRFYASDLVHPSKEAVEYIWEAFSKSLFNKEALELIKEISSIYTGLIHRSLFPASEADKKRREGLEERKSQLIKNYPTIQWPQT